MYKIEKNISIPQRHKYYAIFDKMEKGDSFLVPYPPTGPNKKSNDFIHTKVYYYNTTRKPKKFVARMVETGLRIWRIK